MDAIVSNETISASDGYGHGNDDFLLEEGLEVLALYRSIRNAAIRNAVKEMIAVVANATDNLQ